MLILSVWLSPVCRLAPAGFQTADIFLHPRDAPRSASGERPWPGSRCWRKALGEEAIPGLEKAKQAKRYEPRQFPFMNLGQISLRQGRWREALHGFEGAVRLVPPNHA